jgi:hypothetical protein
MRTPIITLTTDFGLTDHYVGAMKGVILSVCAQARIVDITHHVAPFQIAEAAWLIAQAYPYFRKDTVNVVVVDPGVGSARRPVLVQAAGQYFVGPDNGVFSLVCSREKYKARVISNEKYFRRPVSRTFHGRDIFAPVAAHLAAGVSASTMGKLVADLVCGPFEKPRQVTEHSWAGVILKIDHFGNIVTNFHLGDFPGLEPHQLAVSIGSRRITKLAQNYAESTTGELFLIPGSSGYLEVSVNQGSAAGQIGCKAGEPVEITVG